ncbi:MAG: 2-C-methyl-D-erythritol 2,4-cyclodiphosphate synthase [Clostridiales bacterium]|nr:2-C-methyl-D-erythritol 2,4-cyclodiphosphate synthase [Candidatus Crickella equi]
MNTCKKTYALIVAAGSGSRMHSSTPKQLMAYEGSTVLETVVRKFYNHSRVDAVVVVSPEDGSLDNRYNELLTPITAGNTRSIFICNGGSERYESVLSGLELIMGDAENNGINSDDVIVLIHDAARPGVTDEIIDRNIDAMSNCRATVTATPSIDSIRMIEPGINGETSLNNAGLYPIMKSTVVERRYVYNVQTPQTFCLKDILDAYACAKADGYIGTDDASIAEHFGIEVAIVEGSRANNKITTQEDIPMTTRVGTGYDVHKLVPDRDLIICGTPVPYELGLLGHSDADVATHALMDALLGAAGMGDIGRHFPDNDDAYKGANSLELLAKVKEMLGDVTINNVDITIIAQAPKLAPYNEQMRNNIANTLGIPLKRVNVKATTEEGLGFTGNREGIAAIATCAIEGRFE